MNAIRVLFVAIVASAIIASPEHGPAAVCVLLVVIAADLFFGWMKRRWKSANKTFEKIMEEELGR